MEHIESSVVTFRQLHSSVFNGVAIVELSNLSLFPRLKMPDLTFSRRSEKLTSSMSMTALENLGLCGCLNLRALLDLTHSKLLRHLNLYTFGITLNARVVQDLQARWPRIQILL